MIEFTPQHWYLFQQSPGNFVGQRVRCQVNWRRYLKYPKYKEGVITHLTKGNMVGVMLDGDKNITSFSYKDVYFIGE